METADPSSGRIVVGLPAREDGRDAILDRVDRAEAATDRRLLVSASLSRAFSAGPERRELESGLVLPEEGEPSRGDRDGMEAKDGEVVDDKSAAPDSSDGRSSVELRVVFSPGFWCRALTWGVDIGLAVPLKAPEGWNVLGLEKGG